MRAALTPVNRTEIITQVLNRGAFSPPPSNFNVAEDYPLVQAGPFDRRMVRQASPEFEALLEDIRSAARALGDRPELLVRTWGNRLIITDPWLVAKSYPTEPIAMRLLGLSVFDDTDLDQVVPHFVPPRGFLFANVPWFYAIVYWKRTTDDENGPLLWKTVPLRCPHCVLLESFREVSKEVPERGSAVITVACDAPNDDEAIYAVLHCEVSEDGRFAIDSKVPPMSENGIFVRNTIDQFVATIS